MLIASAQVAEISSPAVKSLSTGDASGTSDETTSEEAKAAIPSDTALVPLIDDLVSKATKLIAQGRLSDASEIFNQFTFEDAKARIASQQDAEAVEGLAVARFGLGLQAEAAGDFALAAEQFLATARLREVALFPNHPYHTIALAKLGGAKRMIGDYAVSKDTLDAALAQAQAFFTPNDYPNGHQIIALVLNDLGVLARSRGDYSAASQYYIDALAMLRRMLPGEDPAIANAENNLAFALQLDGQFAESRRHFEKAIEIYEQPSNRAKPGLLANSATIRHSLGGLMNMQGEYAFAEQYYLEALKQLTDAYPAERFPKGHPQLATACSSLGMLYFDVNDATKSVEYHRRALEYRRALAGNDGDHPDVAMSVRNLANALRISGQADQALALHTQALEMRRRIYSEQNDFATGHPYLAESLRDTSLAYEDIGDFEAAEKLLFEAIAMYRSLYPTDTYPNGHFVLADCLDDMGRLVQRTGRPELATSNLTEATQMRYELAADFLLFAAEAEARNFVHAHLQTPGRLLDLWTQQDVPASVQYELLWRGRRVLPRILAVRQGMRAENQVDGVSREQLDRYLTIRHRLASLSLAASKVDSGTEARQNELRQLTQEKESLERKLTAGLETNTVLRELEAWRNATPLGSDGETLTGPQQLMRQLPSDAAWIDLIEYDSYTEENQERRQIVAFVACQGEWHRVDLGDAESIAELARQFHDSIRTNIEAPQTSSQTTGRIWMPIRSVLSDETNHLFLCPDGTLAQLAWPALRDHDGEYLITRYNFELVPHGPYLLQAFLEKKSPRKDDSTTRSALLVGGVDFGNASETAESKPADNTIAQLTRSAGSNWIDLPGAEQEVDRIAGLLKNDPDDWNLDVLKRGQASVENVLRELESVRVAHFATHGLFALDNIDAKHTPVDSQADSLRESLDRNPLLASGVVLAGANEDPAQGLLLAETIAARPMRQLDLVVLSACDSGQGRLLRGEGVYGLQQAFHLAGAKHVVASRWKVDDAATRALMTEFYRILLSEGLPVSDTLRQAQLSMMKSYDASAGTLRGTIRPSQSVKADEKSSHATAPPFFWAAFCVSGGGKPIPR